VAARKKFDGLLVKYAIHTSGPVRAIDALPKSLSLWLRWIKLEELFAHPIGGEQTPSKFVLKGMG
jgi:hypothetical protein